jgi:exosortase A-associated hydrolase 1
VQQSVVHGPAFWQTTENEHAPALVLATVAALCAISPAASGALPITTPPPAADSTGPRQPLCIALGQDVLWGLLHTPAAGTSEQALGIVVVVGGPQTRLGSHRQFVHLADVLATAGYVTLRFDVRGMGDSTGEPRSFEALDDDIGAAIGALMLARPGLRGVVLWGLCDGASAACLYMARRSEPLVRGLCLANPWVRSVQSLAKTRVRHYYLQRLLTREFWVKLLRGGVGATALSNLLVNIRLASGGRSAVPGGVSGNSSFQDRMLQGLCGFQGQALVLLSEHDYTAQEFSAYTGSRPAWQAVLRQATLELSPLPGADHTFSNPGGKEAVAAATLRWLGGLNV